MTWKMKYIGECNSTKVYWWHFSEDGYNELPEEEWICMAMSDIVPAYEIVEGFTKIAIRKGILEFKTHGLACEKLHDIFEEVAVNLEVFEGYPESEVMTTWHDDTGLASVFWECFHATCVPASIPYVIVCTHFNHKDESVKLSGFLQKFSQGWLPADKE